MNQRGADRWIRKIRRIMRTMNEDAGNSSDLKCLLDAARGAGATRAIVTSTSSIRVDPRVRLKCMIPRCPSYGRNLMCPPNLPAVKEFEEALARYSRVVMIQVEAAPATGGSITRPEVHQGALRLHRAVSAVEKKAFEMGFVLAAGLIGGACRLCDTCVAADDGKACRHPFEARPSMEGMGIDVIRTVRELGLDAEFPAGNRAVWTGCVLVH